MLESVEYEEKCVILKAEGVLIYCIKRQIETEEDNLIIRTPVWTGVNQIKERQKMVRNCEYLKMKDLIEKFFS